MIQVYFQKDYLLCYLIILQEVSGWLETFTSLENGLDAYFDYN